MDSYQAGHKRILYELPTGAGKTETAVKLCEQIISKNLGIIWFIVHREVLIYQLSDVFSSHHIDHSFIFAGEEYDSSKNIILCSIQTLSSRLDKQDFKKPILIITDEAHHSTSRTFKKLYDKYEDVKVLGLTATPRRLDGRPMNAIYDDLIIGPSIKNLINEGWLCEPALYVPPKTADIIEKARDNWESKGGDYKQSSLESTLLGNKIIYGDVIEHYNKFSLDMPTVVFCASVAHVYEVVASFRDAGIPSAGIDGTMSRVDRQDVLDKLRNGELKCVMSCDLISEGFDLPACGCAILLRPTKSLTIYLQQVGRVMRPTENKKEAVIIDHVNNSGLHGAPWINRYWTLEGYKAKTITDTKSSGINLKLCLRCGNYVHPRFTNCPECGYIFTGRKRGTKYVPTTLVKLTPTQEINRRLYMQLRTFDEFYDFAINEKKWSPEFAQKWAEENVVKREKEDRIYRTGSEDEVRAMFAARKGITPEQIETEVKKAMERRNTEEGKIYASGTLSQLEKFFLAKGKLIDEAKKAAYGVLKRNFKETFTSGTKEQIKDVGVKFYDMDEDKAERFANRKIDEREGRFVSKFSGSKNDFKQPSSTGRREYDKFERLVWFAKSGKMTAGVHPNPEQFARNKIQSDNRSILDSGTDAEVLEIAKEMHLEGELAQKYLEGVKSKRPVTV